MNNQAKVQPIIFNPQKLAMTIQEVGIDYLQLESREVETRWFRDATGEVDIFVWMNNEKKIIKQQICIMGLLAEWNIAEGVRTGLVLEDELTKQGTPEQPTASEIIHFDKTVQPQSLMMSIQLLKSVQCIDNEMKTRLLENFQKGEPIGVKLLRNGSHVQGNEENSFWMRVIYKIIDCFKRQILKR